MTILPSITALRCLDSSARLLSFTRAAGEMHLTQGAVSHHILQLEKQLGVQLFLRKRTTLELTLSGRTYWNEIAPLLHQLACATENMIASGGKGRILNLSVSSGFANYWLMPRLHEFLSSHPDVTVNLSTQIGPVDFSNGKDDASIEFCAGASADVDALLVHPLVLKPYVSTTVFKEFAKAHRIHSKKLTKAQLAAFLQSHSLICRTTVMEAWDGWLNIAGLLEEVPGAHLLAGPRYALLSMALHGAVNGVGVSLLPDYVASKPASEGLLTCLSPIAWTASRAYYLRWPHWRADLHALNCFRSWLLSMRTGGAPAVLA
ncbi:LysR family transcriptional regulator [Burkholderia pseudomallei]|uniref:LysR family transcriptional regulator n=1 Tax=Burkholderia pseudomallei TaxID=28450 RepID=UPI000A1A081E|nr:LysR family transcriptional regulator [Burkholderia pseudomallei]ARK94668.1 LysR family transcriptional regulator [Burkholderia pseudomallei]